MRDGSERGLEAGERGGRNPAAVEARCTRLRLELAALVVAVLGEVRRQCDPKPLRVADVQGARRVGPAEPLLRGQRVEVVVRGVDADRARRLGAVDEQRDLRRLAQLLDRQQIAGQPGDVREGEQTCTRTRLGENRIQGLLGRKVADPRDADGRAGGAKRAEQPEVLDVGGDDLVLRGEVETGEDDVAPLRRRGR